MAKEIYTSEWRKEYCVKYPCPTITNPGRQCDYCQGASAGVVIEEDGDAIYLVIWIGPVKERFKLADVCYPAMIYGPGRVQVCTRDITLDGAHLQSVRLTVEICIGFTFLGQDFGQCWTVFGETIYFSRIEALKSLTPASLSSAERELVASRSEGDVLWVHADAGERLLWGAKVINNYANAVTCWTGEPKAETNKEHFFTVAGNGGMSPPGVDVDHVQDPSGQWWKCGEDLTGTRIVVVERSGAVVSAKCKTNGPNQDCV